MKEQINITIDREIIEFLNKEKGLASLSLYINEILKRYVKKEMKKV